MPDLLINGIYPESYFNLIPQSDFPSALLSFWMSKNRYAEYNPANDQYQSILQGGHRSSEVLELDLGRTRQINYLTMGVLKVPVDMRIEYDALSAGDGTHVWKAVAPLESMPFDRRAFFSADARNQWQNCEYYFTGSEGRIVNTRYLRITFERRSDKWPTSISPPFPFPVAAQQVRIGRLVTTLSDIPGPLFDTTARDVIEEDLAAIGNDSTTVKQRFVLPDNAARGTYFPSLMGFSFLVGQNDTGQSNDIPSWKWELRDVTDADPGDLIHEGEAVSDGLFISGSDRAWIDVLFDRGLVDNEDLNRIYELSMHSTNVTNSSSIFMHNPNRIPGRALPGLYTFLNNGSNDVILASADPTDILSAGDYFQKVSGIDASPLKVVSIVFNSPNWEITVDGPYLGVSETDVLATKIFPSYIDDVVQPSRSVAMRLFGDVADEGRDVLGNAYRYADIRHEAEDVFDEDTAGWICAPQPKPDAVEALYFDVRTRDEQSTLQTQIIDALKIAAITPGVHMHVYHTNQNVDGRTPDRIDEWEAIEWTPINQTYKLNGQAIYELPQQIDASFLKLEFSNLNPLPFTYHKYVSFAPVLYKRYPTWVESQFYDQDLSGYKRLVEDWFVRNKTTTMDTFLAQLIDPVREFEYKQKELLSALALGEVSEDRFSPAVQPTIQQFVDLKDHSVIDPATRSRIYLFTNNRFFRAPVASVDITSILGQTVLNRFDPDTTQSSVERAGAPYNVSPQIVSTTNDRISEAYSSFARTPMWFNRRCLHKYRIERANFGKSAYFVGIKSVEFLRANYEAERDAPVIEMKVEAGGLFEEQT